MDQLTTQWILNGAMGLLAMLFGYLLKGIKDTLQDLQRRDIVLADKVQAIEVLVAGDYVKRTELVSHLDKLAQTLERIEDKLDRKADKHEVETIRRRMPVHNSNGMRDGGQLL